MDELLSRFDCESRAFARELRRVPRIMGTLAPHDAVSVLAFSASDVSVRIWYVAWSGVRWWGSARLVRRAGIWTRERETVAEESWDVSVAVAAALSRSAMRFSQLESSAAKSPLHLEAMYGPEVVASGVPRSDRGGLARTLFDDARTHARRPQNLAALAALGGWLHDEVLGGPACDACAKARPETTIALGGDDESDERHLQVVVCVVCRRRALVLDEESRRGAGERVRRHEIDPGAARATIVRAMRECPGRRDPQCSCAGHAQARALLLRGAGAVRLEDDLVDRRRER